MKNLFNVTSSKRTFLRLIGARAVVRHVRSCLDEAAALSPTFKAALDYAVASGLIIQCKRLNKNSDSAASYSLRSRKITLGINDGDDVDDLINSLTHEIRHAWQHAEGLMSYGENFYKTDPVLAMLKLSLQEADAYAHGERAQHEYLKDRAGVALRAHSITMREDFAYWFYVQCGSYCDTQLDLSQIALRHPRLFGLTQGVMDIGRARGQAQGSLDPYRKSELVKLGRSFGGGNYMVDMLRAEPEALPRLMQPSRALEYFVPQRKLGTRAKFLLKHHKREKLKTPLKRLPLPG